jgi:hypothetical protein
MITNFETITRELDAIDLKFLPVIIAGMKAHRGKDNAITGAEICRKVDGLTEPRLRKIVNHIRQNAILPIIATSKGYFTADCVEDVLSQIQSLQDRIDAIKAAQDGLRKFVTQTHTS